MCVSCVCAQACTSILCENSVRNKNQYHCKWYKPSLCVCVFVCVCVCVCVCPCVCAQQKDNVIPYMHIMAMHMLNMISLHGNVKQFSCQGIVIGSV